EARAKVLEQDQVGDYIGQQIALKSQDLEGQRDLNRHEQARKLQQSQLRISTPERELQDAKRQLDQYILDTQSSWLDLTAFIDPNVTHPLEAQVMQQLFRFHPQRGPEALAGVLSVDPFTGIPRRVREEDAEQIVGA